jgi:outer membrane immunogenic protein
MGIRTATAIFAAMCTMHMTIAADAQPSSPAFYDWTGVYVGANAGYVTGNVSETTTGVTSSQTFSGVIAGGQIGANWEYRNVVFGIEVDADWSQQHGSGALQAVSMPWLATARIRIGGDFDRIQYYATGGAAFARLTGTAITGAVASSTRTGWVVGIGQESAINRNLILRFEALYVQLLGDTGIPAGEAPVASLGRLNDYVFRIGLNYKFGWPAN